MAQQQQFCNVDPRIWQECAGESFTVPKLHSRVYYFPLGHLQHSPITPTIQTLSLLRPFILCTVSSIDFLADLETDQIFAKLLLTPVIDATVVPIEASNQEDNGDRVVSYAKTISKSDANNGGGFYVPRACANSIFPPLDLTTPSSSQELSVTDVCGVVWTIRHVHGWNPKRHLFTTGWTAFVKKKHLVGGDTLVFIKNSAGKIFVGIRRHNMSAAASKITKKTFINAVELAKTNTPFEVMCYPRVEGFDFVVEDKVVENAIKVNWNTGMRVTHKVKGGSIFHGTISAFSHPSTHPWRMLWVEWDEPNVSKNLKRVSPWQVKPDFSIALLHQQFPLNLDGMLGVRQNHFSESTSSNSLKDNSMVVSDKVSTDNRSSVESFLDDSVIKRAAGCEMCNECEDTVFVAEK
ncbi:auxin response factor 17-like [Vicia villosa]|uniref:auxin response factor 17-like n=1 Tax=Vicia villosa TaxID=3911 RepID=UPI00273BE447|nr:auxin response factor 17-like [Vicia villosa]